MCQNIVENKEPVIKRGRGRPRKKEIGEVKPKKVKDPNAPKKVYKYVIPTVKCQCGGEYVKSNQKRHEATRKHRKYLGEVLPPSTRKRSPICEKTRIIRSKVADLTEEDKEKRREYFRERNFYYRQRKKMEQNEDEDKEEEEF